MSEPISGTGLAAWIGGLIAKLLPAAIGAAIMLAVEPPKTHREWFVRIFVAFACSYLLGELAFDFLRSTSVFDFLEDKHSHRGAVDGMVAAFGFYAVGGAANWFKRFRKDPIKAVADARDLGK